MFDDDDDNVDDGDDAVIERERDREKRAEK
jgi:hypothetical protein